MTKTGPRDDAKVAAIKLEWWPRSDWNKWPPSLESALSLAAAPSGTGELTISALAFAAGIVTFTAAAGQPTRCYTLLLTATRSDGKVSDYLFKLQRTGHGPAASTSGGGVWHGSRLAMTA